MGMGAFIIWPECSGLAYRFRINAAALMHAGDLVLARFYIWIDGYFLWGV